jgi:hypothetical protein
MIKDKSSVLGALRSLRRNSSEREGTIFHAQGMAVATRLTPEVFNILKIGDQEIQVMPYRDRADDRMVRLGFSSTFPRAR